MERGERRDKQLERRKSQRGGRIVTGGPAICQGRTLRSAIDPGLSADILPAAEKSLTPDQA
jgi:hypothetical protein